jgi:DNA-binding response OmpR family regulator
MNEQKKVLVVDDDAGMRDATRRLLEHVGYMALTAEDGRVGQLVIDWKPDAILLDIWMSGLDGREVCRLLKGNEATKSIPIIMFSANSDVEYIAKESGADDFIEKPFDMKTLVAKIEKHTT